MCFSLLLFRVGTDANAVLRQVLTEGEIPLAYSLGTG
jgi:hypothetical protein